MTEQEIRFLFTVRDTCKANPEMVAEVVQAANAGVTAGVRRPILCAPGALVEGDFAGMAERAVDTAGKNSVVQTVDDVVQVVRAPIDRLQQIVAQSWFWIGGFAVPTDATATSNIIPTASPTYYKRAIILEHAA